MSCKNETYSPDISCEVSSDSIVLSPDQLADDLLNGCVILGCSAVDDDYVILNNIYVVRDEILFMLRMSAERELHLTGILISSAWDYRNYAFTFFYENDSCYIDRNGIVDLTTAQYIRTDYPVDIAAVLK